MLPQTLPTQPYGLRDVFPYLPVMKQSDAIPISQVKSVLSAWKSLQQSYGNASSLRIQKQSSEVLKRLDGIMFDDKRVVKKESYGIILLAELIESKDDLRTREQIQEKIIALDKPSYTLLASAINIIQTHLGVIESWADIKDDLWVETVTRRDYVLQFLNHKDTELRASSQDLVSFVTISLLVLCFPILKVAAVPLEYVRFLNTSINRLLHTCRALKTRGARIPSGIITTLVWLSKVTDKLLKPKSSPRMMYATLNVDPDADIAEIRRRYLKLRNRLEQKLSNQTTSQYYNSQSESSDSSLDVETATQAYHTLVDSKKRKKYDEKGGNEERQRFALLQKLKALCKNSEDIFQFEKMRKLPYSDLKQMYVVYGDHSYLTPDQIAAGQTLQHPVSDVGFCYRKEDLMQLAARGRSSWRHPFTNLPLPNALLYDILPNPPSLSRTHRSR